MKTWLPLLAVPAFIGFWLFGIKAIGTMARMTPGERASRGEPRRVSGWGSAAVNGVSFRSCLKIEEYSDGYLLRPMWLFGAAELWLPREAVRNGTTTGSGFFMPRGRAIVSGSNRVTLYGRLAEFVRGSG